MGEVADGEEAGEAAAAEDADAAAVSEGASVSAPFAAAGGDEEAPTLLRSAGTEAEAEAEAALFLSGCCVCVCAREARVARMSVSVCLNALARNQLAECVICVIHSNGKSERGAAVGAHSSAVVVALPAA